MRKVIAALFVLILLAGTALAERDWSQVMTMPTDEQLAQEGTARSPYIAFFPAFYDGMTAYAMDFRTDDDPIGTYVCPVVFNINTSQMGEKYTRIWTDYSEQVSGYFGFQVLADGRKVVIMSLWNAFCEDENGNVEEIKAKVLIPDWMEGAEFNPDNNGEGSFIQCIYEYDWETGKDYRFVLEQSTGENGTTLFSLFLMEPDGEYQTEMFRFDSGLTDVWIENPCGFLENFWEDAAAWPRTMEIWNIRGRMMSTGEWENAETISFTINGSIDVDNYEGSWNLGQDDDSIWMITSGVPGLCEGPENLDDYPIPATESGVPN
ncbi:MAG: DUF3472 domain-containing protein [Clostridia bacterium]|nr:DUF3472 domain-containing protein [Clostridia bacterium]